MIDVVWIAIRLILHLITINNIAACVKTTISPDQRRSPSFKLSEYINLDFNVLRGNADEFSRDTPRWETYAVIKRNGGFNGSGVIGRLVSLWKPVKAPRFPSVSSIATYRRIDRINGNKADNDGEIELFVSRVGWRQKHAIITSCELTICQVILYSYRTNMRRQQLHCGFSQLILIIRRRLEPHFIGTLISTLIILNINDISWHQRLFPGNPYLKFYLELSV